MDNLEQRMGIADTVCVCCNGEKESVVHLFFQCAMTRAIWFGLNCYCRSELLNINNCEEFVKVVTGDLDFLEHAPLRIAITLEAMWNLRNQILHNKELKVNLVSVIGNMELMILEYIRSIKGRWQKPPPGTIKINLDAAVNPDFTAVAAVARDDRGGWGGGGNLIAWAKKQVYCDAIEVETAAFTWALKLASLEGYKKIMNESDSKLCIDALNDDCENSCWNIKIVLENVLYLKSSFLSCSLLLMPWLRLSLPQTVKLLTQVSL